MGKIKIIGSEEAKEFLLMQDDFLNSTQIDMIDFIPCSRSLNESKVKNTIYHKAIDMLFDRGADMAILFSNQLAYPLHDDLAYSFMSKSSLSSDYLALLVLKEDVENVRLIKNIDLRQKWGRVVLAGFGPGDEKLVTKKAEYNLARADTIVYDDLINEAYLRGFCAEKIYVGKRKGKHYSKQEEINDLLYQKALKGKWVVRLKGGDPMIFGRGAEEYHYLKKRWIDTEVIPGISSAFAAASSAVIPFTERSLSSSVAFLSGHDLDKLKTPKADTLVFYMGASQQKKLGQRLIEEGWLPGTPVAVIYRASYPDQKVFRSSLKEWSEHGSDLPSPSIIMVGLTAHAHGVQPQKWLYTGLTTNEVKLEGHVVHTPMFVTQVADLDDTQKLKLTHLSNFDRIIFSSRHSVKYFFELLFNHGLDVRALAHVRLDAMGEVTAKALKEFGLIVQPLSKDASSDGIIRCFEREKIAHEHILIPRSNLSMSYLAQGLLNLGNVVDSFEVYRAIKNTTIVKQNLEEFQGVVFTSPLTVTAFVEVYGCIPDHLEIKCYGKQTLKEYQKIIDLSLKKETI